MATILHMDTDSVRDFSRWMAQTIEEMKSQVDQTAGSVQSMSWISPAQEQFLAEYEQARANLQRLIQEGETLNVRVANEVNEWESVTQSGLTRFSGVVDSSISLPNVGTWMSTAGGTIAGVVTGWVAAGKQWAADASTTVSVDPNRSLNEQEKYLLKQFTNFLTRNMAGKKLIKECSNEHLGFRLPDGTILGDPKGKIVPIRIGKTVTKGAAGESTNDLNDDQVNDDPGITISDDWLLEHEGAIKKGEVSAVLAHEMQHQLDDKKGLTDYYSNINDFDKDTNSLENYLSSCIQTRVNTEVRAFKRGSEVSPTIFKAVTAQEIMGPASPYPDHYIREINQINNIDNRYHVRISVGQNGNVHVRLSPKTPES